jgi:glycosyltransferase involved in cell wall biosynthesis
MVRLAHRVSSVDQDVGFLLVGEGKEKASLESLARELGVLSKNFWIMDAIPRKSLPEVLSAATVLTSTVIDNPVLWNNSANKFFDALAAGRPIVINHGGWLADLIRESGAGLVLPPDDIDRAAQLLISFVRSESRLELARRAASGLARDRFDRHKLARQLESVLLDAGAPAQPMKQRHVHQELSGAPSRD